MTSPVVRLSGATYGYRGVAAVRATFEVEPGEVVALLGANGSGKSTLVKGMLGLVDSLGGTTEWFGRPLRQLEQRWRIGYVPQRQLAASPVPATVAELVRSGRVARRGVGRRFGSADRRAVADAIATAGLSELAAVPVGHLSGGQQRRALVARALASEADVLVLDEPLAGVDVASQQELATTFRSLMGEQGTMVVVLHELGSLEGLVTRTVCLAAGEVVYDGAPSGRADAGPHDGHHDDPPVVRPRIGLVRP